MQRKRIGLWTAFVFVISSVVAGCSGADEQSPVPESAEQNVESTPQKLDCANAQDNSALADGRATIAEDGALTLSPLSCACCDTLWNIARQACEQSGRRLVGGFCHEVCGLCGRDNSYSKFTGTCQ